MVSTARINRQKISTTIGPDSLTYLQEIVERGEASTLAEAIDIAVLRLKAAENRERLERDTAAYFDQMSLEESAEEKQLESRLSEAARGIDFDREP